MDFTVLADNAISTITSAASGAGPGVIGVVGLLVGVGMVMGLLKRVKG